MRAVPASRYIVFFCLAVFGCAIDLPTKGWMFRRLGFPTTQEWWIWPDVFGFQTSTNRGALFGMFGGMQPLIVAVSLVALLGILYWLFWAGAARDLLLCVALGCVTAGILGNLYDRLGLPATVWDGTCGPQDPGIPPYEVRDWIKLKIDNIIDWPNFNVADSLLVCGAALLVWHAFWGRPEEQAQKAAEKSS
jgi:signal peptidase II